jgi:hypothetical protein
MRICSHWYPNGEPTTTTNLPTGPTEATTYKPDILSVTESNLGNLPNVISQFL